MIAGDRVRVRLGPRNVRGGRVLEVEGDLVVVQLGDLVVTVAVERVERIGGVS